MTTGTLRTRRGLALGIILLALLAVAAAWLMRPRQDKVGTITVNGPAGLLAQVDAAISAARRQHARGLLLDVQFSAACPAGLTEAAARAIKRAPLPVTVIAEADQQGMACAQAFAAQFEQCVGTVAPKSCISRPVRSGSARRALLALAVCALLAAVAWALLRRPRPPVPQAPPPGPPVGGGGGQGPPPPPPGPVPWRQSTGHPLAERLHYPQPAEVRSILDPVGFVAFEGGLWRAAWDDDPPPPGVGTWVLIEYDEPTAQLVARSSR